jgi:hypothetical protein
MNASIIVSHQMYVHFCTVQNQNQIYSLNTGVKYCMYWRVTEKTVASRLPAALAYKLIRRGCSPGRAQR